MHPPASPDLTRRLVSLKRRLTRRPRALALVPARSWHVEFAKDGQLHWATVTLRPVEEGGNVVGMRQAQGCQVSLGLVRVVALYYLLIHAILKSLTYWLPRFLKRHCDRILGEPARRGRRRPVRGARAGLPGGEPAVAALVRVGAGPRLMTYYDRAAAAVFHVLSDASMNALCG